MQTSKLYFFLKSILLILLVCGISLLGAEACFRLLGDRPSADMAGLYIPFGAGSYKLKPEVSTGANWASGFFSVFTDDLGLRCDSARELATRPGSSVDVLFLGDSQGFGNGVNIEDTIAGAAAMAAFPAGWRFANASVGGHSMRNQLELARWLQDEQKIKVANYVVLLSPTMLAYSDTYTRATVGHDGKLYDKPKNPAELLSIYLKTHSVCYSRVRDAFRNSGIGNSPSASAQFILGLYGHGRDEQTMHETLKKSLEEFAGFAAAHCARVRLVYVPLTVEAEFDAVRKAAAKQGISLDRDLPLRVCQTVAAELDLPLENLRPDLERLQAEGQQLHLKGDYHYDGHVSKTCGLDLWHRYQPLLTRAKSAPGTSSTFADLDHGTK